MDESGATSTAPNGSMDASPCVVVFVAGTGPQVEAAVELVRRFYRGRRLVFVCESSHALWFSEFSGETRFVVQQPFNPFGRSASELFAKLQIHPIEACVLFVADLGFESFRFRVFALRLRISRYFLLRASAIELPKPVSRTSFVLLAGATLALRMLLKFPGIDAFQKSVRASDGLGLPNALGRGALAVMARWLRPLDQPLAVGLAWLARLPMGISSFRGRRGGTEIVHLVPHIGMGGVQKQLVLLLKNRSSAYKHRVVVMSSGDRFFAHELDQCGVPVQYLDSEVVRANMKASSNQRWVRAVPKPIFTVFKNSLPFCRDIIKLTLFLRTLEPRPDMVHCWLLVANLAGSIAARLAGVPLVVTSVRNIQSQVNYNYYDPRWQRALERATVPLATAITANAPAVSADYRAFTGVRPKKVVTVPNGVDIQAFRFLTPRQRAEKRGALGLAPEDLVVGTVARLAKEKDFETFFRALGLARQNLPALRSLIVGEGPLRDHVETCAASLGLARLVTLLGERKDVGDLVQCYDAFLLTSVIEGMPNAVMESQLLGVPVIATRAGGTVDLIRDGETGLLAPVGDCHALASCIVRLFTEDGLHEKISRAAGHQIRSGYTVEQLVARTEAIYRGLLGGNDEHVTVPCAG